MNDKPLWEDIVEFARKKKWLAAALIIIGLFGLIVPIIPGLLLIGVAVFLLKPEWWDRFKKRVGM